MKMENTNIKTADRSKIVATIGFDRWEKDDATYEGAVRSAEKLGLIKNADDWLAQLPVGKHSSIHLQQRWDFDTHVLWAAGFSREDRQR